MIKDFQSFLNERDGGLHKVIITVSSDLSDFKYITGDAHTAYTRQFAELFTKGNEPKKCSLPIINFCNIHTQKLLDAGTPKELIYNPEETTFLKLGKQEGATIINGYKMLELQAEKSWRIWNK